MKKITHYIMLALGLLFCFEFSPQAQNVPLKERKAFRIWLTGMKDSSMVRGFLYDCKDSVVIVVKSLRRNTNSSGEIVTASFPFHDIKVIKLRRKGIFIRRFATGSAAGALVGAAIGLSSATNDKEDILDILNLTFAEKTIGGAALLLVPGMIYGAASGLKKTEIDIRGNFQAFESNKKVLKSMALKQEGILRQVLQTERY